MVLKEHVILPEDGKKEAPAKEPPKHKGGRPKKTAEGKETVAEEAPTKKPGRPKKAAAPAESKEDDPKRTTRKHRKAE